MTTLLKELLAISENKSFDVLLEKLGTLQQLKLGKLSRALNQAYRDNGASAVQNKFANRYDTPLGTNSSILDIGFIRNYSNVTKAYRENESISALALSTSATANAFALILMDADSSSKRSRMVGMAYDLTDLNLDEAVVDSIFNLRGSTEKAGWGGEEDVESEKKSSRSIKTHGKYVSSYDKESADPSKKQKEKTFSDYEDWYDHAAKNNATVKNDGNTKIAVDRRGNTVAVWNKETKKGTTSLEKVSPFNDKINKSYGKPSSYEGKTYSVADVRKFIEILLEAGVKVYARAATRDVASMQTRNKRYSNSEIKPKDLQLFKDDLKTRLVKYKNSKLDSVESVKEFIDKAFNSKTITKINFAGRTYITNAESDPVNAVSVLRGSPFNITFRTDSRTGDYNRLYVTFKLVDGVITPIQAVYYDEDNKSIKKKL